MEERFIENVLKNVGRQRVDVDDLTPQDLDQLSSLIADALQVVDRDQGTNRGLSRARTGPRDLEGEGALPVCRQRCKSAARPQKSRT
ncbi:putative receptor-type tyrosine-protein phosphatase N2-like [Scophthalmus maximus]|uniref:Putative receptor-type tyrosine-protein phosphatase N2-like n=1 Tax=Scophthalmus maximus TaxID=52904 RepID=A0A2U9BIR2_SCOMX|nr:putative receptor-type tyrosine-protein phosphatase N2-like [Scophthalmus maximus]